MSGFLIPLQLLLQYFIDEENEGQRGCYLPKSKQLEYAELESASLQSPSFS